MMINIWSVVQAYAFFTEYFEKIGGKEKLFMSNVFFFFISGTLFEDDDQ